MQGTVTILPEELLIRKQRCPPGEYVERFSRGESKGGVVAAAVRSVKGDKNELAWRETTRTWGQTISLFRRIILGTHLLDDGLRKCLAHDDGCPRMWFGTSAAIESRGGGRGLSFLLSRSDNLERRETRNTRGVSDWAVTVVCERKFALLEPVSFPASSNYSNRKDFVAGNLLASLLVLAAKKFAVKTLIPTFAVRWAAR